MMPIFHLYSTPALGALVVPFATPDFAATMLNLIRAEVSVTAGWLPSSHVLQRRGIFLHLSEMAS
jgi:hypothetical protein